MGKFEREAHAQLSMQADREEKRRIVEALGFRNYTDQEIEITYNKMKKRGLIWTLHNYKKH